MCILHSPQILGKFSVNICVAQGLEPSQTHNDIRCQVFTWADELRRETLLPTKKNKSANYVACWNYDTAEQWRNSLLYFRPLALVTDSLALRTENWRQDSWIFEQGSEDTFDGMFVFWTDKQRRVFSKQKWLPASSWNRIHDCSIVFYIAGGGDLNKSGSFQISKRARKMVPQIFSVWLAGEVIIHDISDVAVENHFLWGSRCFSVLFVG